MNSLLLNIRPDGEPITTKALLDAKQLAELIGVKVPTVRRWCSYGDIPTVPVGRLVRFKPADVLLWIESGGPQRVNETQAVKRCFGRRAYEIPMSSIKSMIGHPQGASGASAVVAAILGMNHGFLPPTINHEEPDAEHDRNQARPDVGRAEGASAHECQRRDRACLDERLDPRRDADADCEDAVDQNEQCVNG